MELDDLVHQTSSAKIGAKVDVLPFFFSLPSCVVCTILVSQPGIKPVSPHSESAESQLLDP